MNYLKKLAMAVLILAIPLFIVSCSDDDDDNGTSDKNIVEIAQGTPSLSILS